MEMATDRKVYFILHLEERDRYSSGMRYEIQLLDTYGQTIARGCVDDQANSLELQGCSIPQPVIEAARKQAIGNGDYVDEAGYSVSPF
ncbi:hypothetical protein Pan44_03940 [Caulifigura coniformis]|uniref:Uncharacterized protein n=1 Tax=Caulifigura coniformis TaxID=2527983 RepID=A0A517S8D2_9PLAN|nr:hypothetical protein [Caulifigura coniformis]QDT52384.1 hypothetical protein Pan44_03940 [Caulifigura coniformis]